MAKSASQDSIKSSNTNMYNIYISPDRPDSRTLARKEHPPRADLRKMMDQHPLPVLTPSPIDPGSIDGEKATSYARGVLDRLNAALAANDAEALESCFYADQAYWKDQLALTWHLRTFRCPGTIAASFLETARLRNLSSGITIDGEAVFLPATPALVCPESPIAYSP